MMVYKIKIGIIGGTGLDDPDLLKNRKEKKVSTPFGDPSDVLITGDIDGIPCVLLSRHGRKHTLMPDKVNYRANIWALKQEECTHILATTATGSLKEEIKPGELVILDNFIDRTQGRAQTFYDGEPGHPTGACHLPIEPGAYSEDLRQLVLEVAGELNLPVHNKGTIVVIQGPRFSSKAESNMFRSWGGDVIGMTSVPEVVLAKEAGILYAQIALITDYDVWRDSGEKVTQEMVFKNFHANAGKLLKLLPKVVTRIADKDWDKIIKEFKDFVDKAFLWH